MEMPLEDVEKNHILRALTFNQGNKTKTAQSLGITIKTLYNKLHRYGIVQTQNAQKNAQNQNRMI
jgi:DNA-binding NtrC family response regulator